MSIFSVRDGSLVVIAELTYSLMINLELGFRSLSGSAKRARSMVKSRTITGSDFASAITSDLSNDYRRKSSNIEQSMMKK
jgi:hypothetical protein